VESSSTNWRVSCTTLVTLNIYINKSLFSFGVLVVYTFFRILCSIIIEEVGFVSESKKQDGILKGVAKGIKEGLTFGSVFDPDMSQKKVEETREFTAKDVVEHFTGKEKLSDDEVEELKRAAKYNRNT